MQQNAEHHARRWVAYPPADLTVDERSHAANYRGLLAELDAARARVAELEAENAKLRTQRQHLSDWSGTDIAEIDRMYAAGERP